MFEVIAGTVIATLAVVGLAYSFGVGRGLIDRYEIARRAMGRARLLVDSLSTVTPLSLADGNQPFWVDGIQAGTSSWTMTNVDDPADQSGAADPNPVDEKRILVRVGWGLGGSDDTLSLSRLVVVR